MTVTSFSQTVTTIAGTGSSGGTDGTGNAASFSFPSGIAIDVNGDLFIVDTFYHKIRKVTQAGVVTTFAGTGSQGNADGTLSTATFSYPSGITIDGAGNFYIASQGNQSIRKITPAGDVTTLAGSPDTFSGDVDGTGPNAFFYNPYAIAVSSTGDLFVVDGGNHKIRKVTQAGVVTTFAGTGVAGYADGTGITASFNDPRGIAIDASDNLYVGDANNFRIRKITPAGVVSTFAGSGTNGSTDGTGVLASVGGVFGIAIDVLGDLYFADTDSKKIRKVTSAGVVTTIAGSGSAGSADGIGSAASFIYPEGIAIDAFGRIFVGDVGNYLIRKISIRATNLNFDGSNDYVTIPYETLNGLPQGTISTWVKFNALTQQTICSQQINGFASKAIFTIGGNGASAGQVSYQSTNGSKLISNATLVTNQWYNLTVTFNNAGAKLYIDGVLDKTVVGNFIIPNTSPGIGANTTTIGAWLGDGNGQYFNGNIEEFRVWNKALTATDITNTMNCELQSTETGLVAYYKFNNGDAGLPNTGITNLLDGSGNLYNGTLTNFALTGTTSNWLAGSPVTTGNTCTSLTTLSNSSFEVANNIKMYPNPTNNFVMVEVSNLTNAKLQVVDITGKILMNQSLNASSNTINVQQLPSGIYFFKVVSNEGTSTNKIIKN